MSTLEIFFLVNQARGFCLGHIRVGKTASGLFLGGVILLVSRPIYRPSNGHMGMGDPKNTVSPFLYVPTKAPKGVWAIPHWVLTLMDVPGGYIFLIPLYIYVL